MAAPTFRIAGAGSAVTGTNLGPATSVVGELGIVQVFQDGTGTDATCTSLADGRIEDLAGTVNALTFIGTFNVGGSTAKQHLWVYRTRTTTQARVTVTCADSCYIRLYHFADVAAGTALTDIIENNLTTGAGGTFNNTGVTAAVGDAEIQTMGVDRLAVNLVGVNDDNAVDAFTGTTGGTWVEAVAEFASATGTDGCIQLQTAPMATAGTIEGGSYTMAAADAWSVVGFALKPVVAGGSTYTKAGYGREHS